ncbi:hypothetical protein EIQ28_01770 [Xanthomonas campestris pv. plantaginis]
MQVQAQEGSLVTAPGYGGCTACGNAARHAAPGWRVHQSDAPVDHTDASIAQIDLERAKRRS